MAKQQQQTVADAQAVLERVNRKIDDVRARIKQIAEDRQKLGFAVHVESDPNAIKALAALDAEAIKAQSELETLTAAMREAAVRVTAAQQAQAAAADKVKIKAIRETVGAFVEASGELDDALRDVNELGALLINLCSQLHSLGVGSPTHEQLNVLGWQCVATSLMGSPWHKRTDFLPPNQRRDFRTLAAGWQSMINNGLRAREGEQQKEREVA